MGFGIKTKELDGSRINNGLCSLCTAEAVYNAGSIKLLHFWGIPLLPIYAAAKVRCANCGSVVKLAKASTEARANATSMITPKILLTSSWGLAFAMLAVIGLVVLGMFGQKETQEELSTPMTGDVYVVKMLDFIPNYQQKTYPYGVLKISSIEGQNVHFVIANNTYGNMKSVHKSLNSDGKKSDFYSSEHIEADIASLKARYDSGAIKEVNR
jgi:hypothetical protein